MCARYAPMEQFIVGDKTSGIKGEGSFLVTGERQTRDKARLHIKAVLARRRNVRCNARDARETDCEWSQIGERLRLYQSVREHANRSLATGVIDRATCLGGWGREGSDTRDPAASVQVNVDSTL